MDEMQSKQRENSESEDLFVSRTTVFQTLRTDSGQLGVRKPEGHSIFRRPPLRVWYKFQISKNPTETLKNLVLACLNVALGIQIVVF
jgi:hypothetical protein